MTPRICVYRIYLRKILSTFYKTRLTWAAVCRDGVEVYGDDVSLDPQETRPLLLQVPPGYNPGDAYRLRIEGYHRWAEALLVFITMIPSGTVERPSSTMRPVCTSPTSSFPSPSPPTRWSTRQSTPCGSVRTVMNILSLSSCHIFRFAWSCWRRICSRMTMLPTSSSSILMASSSGSGTPSSSTTVSWRRSFRWRFDISYR